MMKNKKLRRTFVVGASIFVLAGCGTPNGTDTNGEREAKDIYIENGTTDSDKKDSSNENNSNDVGSMDGDEIIAALDNKDYYGFPLGTCAYLIAVQKKSLGAYEEAILWFDAAKDVLQPQDLYYDDIVKEITALQKMGYQLPQKKTRKKSI